METSQQVKEQENMTKLELSLLEMLLQKMFTIAKSKIESETSSISDFSLSRSNNCLIYGFWTKGLGYYNAASFNELVEKLEEKNELNKEETA